MKKLLLSIIIFFIVSSTAITAYHSDFITYSFIKYSDFKEIQNNIFVSPDTSSKQQTQLLELIKTAKNRIREKFGVFTSSPIIISSYNTEWREKYTNNSYASTTSLPFKDNKAYIFIGENGHNIDIISHELVHAEVFSYLGYFNQKFKIPVWFNEGIAMQVDLRDQYKTPPKNRKELSQLKYGWQFYNVNSNELTENYSLVKNEVYKWLNQKGQIPLNQFLVKIRNGKNFKHMYNKSRN